jgi:acetate kinase
MDGLDILGIRYDKRRNELARTRNAEMDISAPDSKVKVFVIPTDEEAVFIEDVVKLLNHGDVPQGKYRYSFEDPAYRNEMREQAFEEECKKNPDMRQAVAKIPVPNKSR